MIKIQIIGHLAHDNKLFDVQCTKCGIMYDSKALNSSNSYTVANCPKCNSPLDSIRAKNNRTMAISEGTIYPTLTDADKAQDAENVAKRKNAMPIAHRFVLFSFANKETGILQEPPVHQYLASGREVMIEVGHNPIASWYKAKDQSIKLELRYTILYHKGDKVQLLGRKETTSKPVVTNPQNIGVMAPIPQIDPNTAAAVMPEVSAENAATIAELKLQIATLIAKRDATPVEVAAQQNLFPADEDPFA